MLDVFLLSSQMTYSTQVKREDDIVL